MFEQGARFVLAQVEPDLLKRLLKANLACANIDNKIRKQLIEARAVDVMVAVGPNMFYTVTLPATLWFFEKAKTDDRIWLLAVHT